MARSTVPTVVVYGDRDSVVPPALSAEVADRVGALVREVVLEGAVHNDAVMFGPAVAREVARLAEEVGPGEP